MAELKAPAHLKAATRAWWLGVMAEYELEPHHVRLLTLAAESWDRCVQARQALAKEGLTYTDKLGYPHPRPEVAIERDARIAFVRLVREMDLDVAPPAAASRAPALNRRRA